MSIAPPPSVNPPPPPGPFGVATSIRFAVLTALGLTAVHVALWVLAATKKGESFAALLLHWDGGHYTAIVTDGYAGERWVFYPAWPMLVRAVASVLRVSQPQWVGFFLSLLLFLAFVAWVPRLIATPNLPEGLVPRTRLGFLFFLLGPASYVFHSQHTESLFLLLSFGAFSCAATRRPLAAGLFAAACALTRNQGVFVGLCAALLAASVEETRSRRLRALGLVGGQAVLGVGAFLLFQWLASGSPWTFLSAQSGWAHVTSPLAAVKTLVFANSWQSTDGANVLRYVAWWVSVAGSVWLVRRSPALGAYALLCFLVQLPQGELVNTLRFAAPVFPLFFAVGDTAARLPRAVQVLALAGLLALNLHTAYRYGLGLWAY